MSAPQCSLIPVKFLPWPTMPRKPLDSSPHSERNDSPDGGAGARPIRCVNVTRQNVQPPVTTGEQAVSATGFQGVNPVALPVDNQDSQSGCGNSTSPQDRVKFSSAHSDVPEAKSRRAGRVSVGKLATVETLAAKRRRLARERAARLEEAAARARPEGTNALGHSQEQQQAYGLEVLLSAYRLALADTQAGGRHPRAYVLEAAGGGIAGHYALGLLGYLAPRPHSTREALALLADAILRAGGALPAPKRRRRKSGPKVASGAPSAAEVERRRALVAAAAAQPQPRPPLIWLARAGLNCCVPEAGVPMQRTLLMLALEKLPPLALLASVANEWGASLSAV